MLVRIDHIAILHASSSRSGAKRVRSPVRLRKRLEVIHVIVRHGVIRSHILVGIHVIVTVWSHVPVRIFVIVTVRSHLIVAIVVIVTVLSHVVVRIVVIGSVWPHVIVRISVIGRVWSHVVVRILRSIPLSRVIAYVASLLFGITFI